IPDVGLLGVSEEDALRKAGKRWGESIPLPSNDDLKRADPFMREVIAGSFPGSKYARVRQSVDFRPVDKGVIRATLNATEPRTGLGRVLTNVKNFAFGDPLAVSAFAHERLTKVKALAVLSSDAISSVAYATEQILLVLLVAGSVSFGLSLPIGGAIVALMLIVGLSYRQTIRAYPRGGGSYIVARDNLGDLPGLGAASALMIGYTLTVAVSIAAGVAALISAYPALSPFRIGLGIACILLVTLGNLRGIREAGTIFAVPTYAFIVGMYALIGIGFWKLATGTAVPSTLPAVPAVQSLGILLVLRAFSNGASAMTGTEAISDGVPAFQRPEWRNARTTLTIMVGILASMFASITVLAHFYQVQPDPTQVETLLSRLERLVVGGGPMYYYLQYTTFFILVLAANTAFSDFPRLLYFLSRDSFAPRLFRRVGGRLAFSNGIITLAILAAVLYVAFGGQTDKLIPLYSIGVFGAFTLSQFGMFTRWRRLKETGWQRGLVMNGLGATATCLVTVVSVISKFTEGAWFALILIPVLVSLFLAIHRHYQRAERELSPGEPITPDDFRHIIVCPIVDLNTPAMRSLAYARSLTPHVIAVHISPDEEDARRLQQKWEMWGNYVPLEIIESPYRGVVLPLLAYIDALRSKRKGDTVTIVLPEYIAAHWWERLLHNQTALRLKASLLFRPNVVVTNIPYHLTG
ncbi:MAG: APC family permease, partial [Dehalococcoidia bacterium]